MIRSKEARQRRLGLLVLAAAAFVVALVPSAGAHDPLGDAIISNGVVQLGVHSIANLNVPGPASAGGTSVVGLRYVPTNNESTAPGCLCEGWGAADASAPTVTGFANEANGTSNVTATSFTSTSSTAVSVVTIAGGEKTMQVTHDYHPSGATPNLYEVTVTIENTGSADIGDLRYRRVMDWDVEPTAFREYSTINGRAFPNLLFTSNDGFATSNPLGARSSRGSTGFFTDAGPADHGALFDFGFGALKPGEKTIFNTYYGAAGNESDAVSAVGAVGAEVWSFGQPSTEGNPTSGTPNTFIFAFGSVGGEPFAGRDPRPPVQLDVFAPDEVASGEAFTVRSVLSNVGAANATGVTTRIELGPGLTLDSGEPSRSVGTIGPGQTREESFVVRTPSDCADRVYSYDVFADYAERPEGETERHVSEMIVVRGTGCPDTTPPPPPPPPQESPPPPPPPPPPADLSVDVRSDPTGTVAAGTLVSYLVTITNNGPGTARNVVGSHTAPAGAEFVSVSSDHNAAFARRQTGPGCSGTTTVTCSLGTLVVGEQAHITHVVRLTTAGSASSSASASASEVDPTPANNTSSVTVTVAPATPPGGGGGGGGTGGQLPPPVVGVTVNVRPVGNVFVVRPDGTRVPLTDPSQLTFPVTIDVSAPGARVTLTVATAGGGTEAATFYGGVFNVDQNLVATPARSTAALTQSVALTELALRSGNFAQCNAPAKGKAKGKGKKSRSLSSVEQRSNKPVRRLWGNGKGNFRTRGRYSSATVRGTIWLTQDQCNGTLTRVTQGVVLVNDFTRKRQQLVRAGKSYLALAPKGKR